MTIGSVLRPCLEFARRAIGREHGCERLDVERDLLGGVLGLIGIVREHDRDRLADIAHARSRQQRLAIGNERLDAIVAEVDRRQIGDVVDGPDRHHARRASAPRTVDLHDPPMRDRRAHDAHVKHVGKRDIGREQATAAHQRHIFEARHRGADDSCRGSLRAIVVAPTFRFRSAWRHPSSACIASSLGRHVRVRLHVHVDELQR